MKVLKGSICVDDIFAASKEGHVAFNKSKNGKTYANIVIFENDKPNQYGNTGAIALSGNKEDKTTYIGNLREPKANNEQQGTEPTDNDSDLPF